MHLCHVLQLHFRLGMPLLPELLGSEVTVHFHQCRKTTYVRLRLSFDLQRRLQTTSPTYGTCVYRKISTKWHGPEIKQIVTGIRKRNFRFTGGPSRVESLLTSALIHKVVSTADALRIQNGFQELCVIAWWFLLRVSNEGIPLQAGHITDSF